MSQPDLVITDLIMPVMDGFQFIKQIRNNPDLQHYKIIVSSASVSEADQRRALETGGNDFLAKPVDAYTLFQLLATHLTLEWVHEPQTNEEESKESSLVSPPYDTLNSLLMLAQQAHMKDLRELLEELVKINIEYKPFADPILHLAQQFRAEEIEELLETYLTQT